METDDVLGTICAIARIWHGIDRAALYGNTVVIQDSAGNHFAITVEAVDVPGDRTEDVFGQENDDDD